MFRHSGARKREPGISIDKITSRFRISSLRELSGMTEQ